MLWKFSRPKVNRKMLSKAIVIWLVHVYLPHSSLVVKLKKSKLYSPFLWMGSTASRLLPLLGGSLLFTIQFPEIPGIYSFYWPWKDERLSRPWSHPVVLNTGLLDWESSTLTTRPLLHKHERLLYSYILLQVNSLLPQNFVKWIIKK